jgi:hypothetical protein
MGKVNTSKLTTVEIVVDGYHHGGTSAPKGTLLQVSDATAAHLVARKVAKIPPPPPAAAPTTPPAPGTPAGEKAKE